MSPQALLGSYLYLLGWLDDAESQLAAAAAASVARASANAALRAAAQRLIVPTVSSVSLMSSSHSVSSLSFASRPSAAAAAAHAALHRAPGESAPPSPSARDAADSDSDDGGGGGADRGSPLLPARTDAVVAATTAVGDGELHAELARLRKQKDARDTRETVHSLGRPTRALNAAVSLRPRRPLVRVRRFERLRCASRRYGVSTRGTASVDSRAVVSRDLAAVVGSIGRHARGLTAGGYGFDSRELARASRVRAVLGGMIRVLRV